MPVVIILQFIIKNLLRIKFSFAKKKEIVMVKLTQSLPSKVLTMTAIKMSIYIHPIQHGAVKAAVSQEPNSLELDLPSAC